MNEKNKLILPYSLQQVISLEKLAIEDADSLYGSGVIIGLAKKVYQLEEELQTSRMGGG